MANIPLQPATARAHANQPAIIAKLTLDELKLAAFCEKW
jgi:hypothetical protein